MTMPQIWAVNSQGGFMYSETLSKVLRMAVQPSCKFRQFADIKDAAVQGKKKGDTFHWNVYSNVAQQGTTLVETNTMPKTQFTITQGTMTITEAGNSVDYTGKLDDLSEHPVKEIINNVLKNDAKKFFDISAHAQFNATPLRVIATGGTDTAAVTLYTNGTVTGTNNVALNKDHWKAIIDTMKERDIPPMVGDDYMAIGPVTSFRRIKNDLEAIHQYTERGFGMIATGEIGRYENCRAVEQTNIAKGSWANAKSNWVYFFGQDTVAEGIANPEEMRGKIPGDYGRDKGVAWYYLGGFGIVHGSATPVQARIVKWDSQG
jgi:N4-gp56 family major capsid protein